MKYIHLFVKFKQYLVNSSILVFGECSFLFNKCIIFYFFIVV